MGVRDPFQAKKTLSTPMGELTYYDLRALEAVGPVERLPYSVKILLESALRNLDGFAVTEAHVRALIGYDPKAVGEQEIPFMPGRVVLQDFTGVPAVVDLAALRSAVARMGGDVEKVNPLVPCDLVIDHSVQVDHFGTRGALDLNAQLEFDRNAERYAFLKWGQQAFKNFRVVPPATGIVHQVNLEHLAKTVWTREVDGETVIFPDSLVGTDSHTTMINGLGVLGWGVGGIEAEAVMLGEPIAMLLPEVIGFELEGALPEGATATDLVLTVTQLLRKRGVVGKFVEFYGPGLAALSLPDRATIANMAPEYGATVGFFPVDEQTLAYLRQTGRDEALVSTVEQYCKAQGLWREDSRVVTYTDTLKLNLADVEPSLAGPRRPQDRIALSEMKTQWRKDRVELYGHAEPKSQELFLDDPCQLEDGAVVIAAITSCTNTSNPAVLIAAGLVARKARARGMKRKPWVKTSLAPGSRVVTDYLNHAGLTEDLNALGFHTVGYGCTTCIGNSGPLIPEVADAVIEGGLTVAAVLSGNRNFEGRINPLVQPSYLASPPLVVAYALAGTVDVDLATEPLALDGDGKPVWLAELWPTSAEVAAAVAKAVDREQFINRYADMAGPALWQAVPVSGARLYDWQESSTYIQEPPFFQDMKVTPDPIAPINGARVLLALGDSVTTDHISPAGDIEPEGPAGRYLRGNGVSVHDFNSFGARRGNDRVMTRGTFANIRLSNALADAKLGGFTRFFGPEVADGPAVDEITPVFKAAMAYQKAGVPLVVLAGRDYGMGSSRDWAAKGTYLLGVRAVIAESFERIHRSNLVGMGVLPLQFSQGASLESLGLTGEETFDIPLTDELTPQAELTVIATRPDGERILVPVVCRIDTPVEVVYYRNGGILHTVLRKMVS